MSMLTLIGLLRMLSELLSMLEDSRKDIGRFWRLDPERNHVNKLDGEW